MKQQSSMNSSNGRSQSPLLPVASNGRVGPSHTRRRRVWWRGCYTLMLFVPVHGVSGLVSNPSSSSKPSSWESSLLTPPCPGSVSMPSSSRTSSSSLCMISEGGDNCQEVAGIEIDPIDTSNGADTTVEERIIPSMSENGVPRTDNGGHGSRSSSSSLFPSPPNVQTVTEDSPKFGDVVSIRPKNKGRANDVSSSSSSSSYLFGGNDVGTSTTVNGGNDGINVGDANTNNNNDDAVELLANRKQRNIGVAVLSVALAVLNYIWQWTHPIGPIQLLYTMEQNSAPITAIGTNGKPTVIDFWAPWCENCKYMAPTLYQIEGQYRDRVNFIMVNGDKNENWPLIEALGVDAIPHLALLEADGVVDTALIGRIPKGWLTQDLDVLIENASIKGNKRIGLQQPHDPQPLPHQMLDVFANKPPEERRIHFDTTTTTVR